MPKKIREKLFCRQDEMGLMARKLEAAKSKCKLIDSECFFLFGKGENCQLGMLSCYLGQDVWYKLNYYRLHHALMGSRDEV